MRYNQRGSLMPQNPRVRYRPPHPTRVAKNGGGRFSQTGRSMRYTRRGATGLPKTELPLSTSHPTRAVDGLLLVSAKTAAVFFRKRGGRCGILTGDRWAPKNRASAQAVDGLLFVAGQNDDGRFHQMGGRCGISTGDRWGLEGRASDIDFPPNAGGRWLTFGAWPKWRRGIFF